MSKYWVNNRTDTNPNNDHEVHVEGCSRMSSDKKYLEEFSSCSSAIREAKKLIQK
ncbi:MAG: hypothetical protein ACNS60_09350 [Candidatus Cyclobacteriaceae bacterium M2_1C_046]